MAKEAIIEEKQDSAERGGRGEARTILSADGEESGNGSTALEQANEALHGLRAAVDHASQSLRELSRAGGQWAKDSQERALALGKDLRGRGERAVGGVTRQVEHNPLTSLAVAFAVGFICAALVRR
jgi:ElaB/YqjD/DUF883 family membrane-anchored ribosome-binding protein